MNTQESLQSLSKDELIQMILHDQMEFDEFRASSSELEKMLEVELENAQKDAKEKDRRLRIVEMELERLQDRTQAEKKEGVKIEESLRTELKSVKVERDAGKARIRELEQKNDDLERTERNNQQEMEDLISKLNQAMERTSLLENEIAEKQAASEEMYRLREELKERPRLVVGPLRMERTDYTPDEPTPGKDMPELRGEQPDILKGAASPCSQEITEHETKSFSSRVNRIMRDLIVKVDLLEGVLTRLKHSRP